MNHPTRPLFGLLLAATIASTASLMGAPDAKAQGMPGPPDFHVTATSKYDFDDTVALLKGAIEQQNLMVIHEIDAQRMLRMVQVQTKGMKQILFFHPRYMKRIREVDPNGAIEAPLKVLVMERPDGKVMVRYVRPTYLLGRYSGLEEIGEELDSVVSGIVETTTE